jgi:CO/xanthine dehydrogenase FAD-binding subunit
VSFSRPATLDDALARLAAFASRGVRPTLLAGGTDWMVERHMVPPGTAPREPGPVIDITAIDALRTASRVESARGNDGFAIGAGVSYLAMRRDPLLAREVPMLAAMAVDVGAIQIQARGTLGGNLATGSPAADGVPVLMALGCDVVLMSKRGTRAVNIDDFYTGYRRNVMAPDEMIHSVVFETPARWFWRKVGTRRAQSIAKVALAATARVENGSVVDARFGMASVAPTTVPLRAVREAMVGRRVADLDGAALDAALARDIAPIDDVRSTREYRLHVAGRLLRQFVATLRA